MSEPTADRVKPDTLRQQAQQQLVTGAAPPSRGWGVGVEALALLHRLASSPASAADALKVLHELQVHQVELDLQQAQMEAVEHELEAELGRYRCLYELAPVAFFVLDPGGRIADCNRAGAALLETAGGESAARRFDALLTLDSRLRFTALLDALRDGAQPPRCTLQPLRSANAGQRWQVDVAAEPVSGAVLLVVSVDPGSPPP